MPVDRTLLLSHLAIWQAKGFDEIRIEYNGSGDSGDLDGTYYLKGGQEVVIPDNDRDASEALLDAYAWEILEDHPDDWVNNDGGYGRIIIDLHTYAVQVQHNQRITDVEYSEWSPPELVPEEEPRGPKDVWVREGDRVFQSKANHTQ